MISINTVTVIGVTGTMGANVAGIFASFGDAKVYCVGRNIEKVKKTIPRIVKSVRADAIKDNLIAADYSMLNDCIVKSDLVFESVAEDIDIKKDIAIKVGKYIKKGTISCTGSSGLSITKLAECYPEDIRHNFFGVHMFNPPYSMSLCEVIPTKYSNKTILESIKEYLEKRLYRTVVEVKDSPAFLGNRIGFQFINEAMQYAEKYMDNGGIDYIDSILGPFTGRMMAPLVTSDFVGLDVHKAIVDNLFYNTNDYCNDTFKLPQFVNEMISQGFLGRKSEKGLYQTIKFDNGYKRRLVYDIKTGIYRDVIPYVFPFVEEMKKSIAEGDYKKAFSVLVNNHSQEAEICISFLLRYIVYSIYCSGIVANNVEAADDVMATGFNWCPPLAMYEALSTVSDVTFLIRNYIPKVLDMIDILKITNSIKESEYDYRQYFRSGR